MTLTLQTPLFLLLLPLALWPVWPLRSRGLTVSTVTPLLGRSTTWRTRVDQLRKLPAVLALMLACLLLAGPALQQVERQVVREGIDIMLVTDISASMAARDMQPNRITVAREVVAQFLQQRHNDRIGVILFSGIPYLLSPTTEARQQVAALVRQIEVDISGNGTALGDALLAGVDRLRQSASTSKVIILLTDGTSNRGRMTPLDAARLAREQQVRVYTIGFGTGEGAEISLGKNKQLVRDRLETAQLRQIANMTGGEFFLARDAASLKNIYQQIDALEKSPLESFETSHSIPLTPWLRQLLIAVLILELLCFRCWLRRLP